MRLYAGTSRNFISDSFLNQIAGKLKSAFFDYYGFNPSDNEVNSWRASLLNIAAVFQNDRLLDHGVILEYQLPLSSRRIDCLICGRNNHGLDNAVIVELKQWSKCEESIGENEVMTWVGGAKRDVLHPSAQVSQYKYYLQDTHTAFYEEPNPVLLHSCSYLHNYDHDPDDVIFHPKFKQLLSDSPAFTADDTDRLSSYLCSYLGKGEGIAVLNRIEGSRYRPSKKLMEHVSGVIRGNPQYVLLDEQKVVYDKIFALVNGGFHKKQKHVIIVKGGPGTGKSVIAINLIADLFSQHYNTSYATGSRAFTETLRKAIGPKGPAVFKYFNTYTDCDQDEIDVLICDESHRIRQTSYNRFVPKKNYPPRSQIDELLTVARVCVFFIDDLQVVRPGEIGSSDYIKRAAQQHQAVVHEHELDVQFRCAGSESFVNWVDCTLAIRRTATVLWSPEEDFDFRIFDSPFELENAIRDKAMQGYTARVTAGFCWPWAKQLNQDGTLVSDVVIGDYVRPWNANPELSGLPKDIPKAQLWAYDPNGINQIGCIYTAQGFEFDYAGVIMGKDLAYSFEQNTWLGDYKHSYDPVVKKSGSRFLELVKNTYRVLLSRGLKGCYVYFMDKPTEQFVRTRIAKH
jgi:hypothetical protein